MPAPLVDQPIESHTAVDGGVLHDRVVAKLMNDAQVGIWRYNPDEDTYHFSSELDLGYPTGVAVVPREILVRIQHPEDGRADARIRERLTREGGEAQGEIRYRHAAGHWIHLLVHYRSGRKLASGLFEMYGISQNVTAQAEARDAAREGDRQVRLAMQAAHAAAFEFDFKTRKYTSSDELARLVGARGLKRLERNTTGIFHPSDRERVREFSRQTFDAGQIDPLDLRVIGPKGYFWARLFFEVEKDSAGLPIRGVGLIIDVDAGKRQELALEEARAAAEAATLAKSTFLASVSHEIRTPLNGVSGILHLLKGEALPGSARELMNQALDCSDMLGRLINDILDFSKIEAGKLDVALAPTEIGMAVKSVVAMLTPAAQAKGLWLRVKLPDDAGWAMVDPLRLRQCLFNIAGNAVKFTHRGGVEIRLSVSGGGAGQRLRYEIEDTGIGIPEAARKHLFDRFQQAESGTTREFGGTGLGLTIARSLALLMGGDMGFDSTPGQGSTFWFEVAAPACDAAGPAADLSTAGAPLEGLRILVVDDNAINRLVASRTVEAMGAVAAAADSGPAAVEALKQGDYDLVLMDINMPGMDGMEATRRIRALAGSMACVPVIALTADVMSHQRQNYLAAGMNGLAPKPFSPSQLLTEIARLMSGAGASKSREAAG